MRNKLITVAIVALVAPVLAIVVFALFLLALWRGVSFFRRRQIARPTT